MIRIFSSVIKVFEYIKSMSHIYILNCIPLVLQINKLRNKVNSLFSNEGFRKYFFNTGWMFAEKLLRLVAGVFVGAYVARYLGPSQYGLLNYVISLVGLISIIAMLGLDTILVRELVKDEGKRNSLLGTTFILRITTAVVVYIIFIVSVQFTSENLTTKILIYIVGLTAVAQSFGVIEYYFKAIVSSKHVVASQIIALSFVSVLRIIFVFQEASVSAFAWATVLDYFIFSIGLIFFYQKNRGGVFKWKFELTIAKELLRVSWPLIFSGLSITAYMRFNQLMVKWMLGNEAAGYYGVCVRLSEMWYFIPIAICSSVFPSLINTKKSSETLFLKRLQHLYNLMVLISVSVALPLTIFSDFFVTILFGEAYSQSADIMSLYVWSGVFTSLGIASANWVIIEGLQTYRLVCLVIAGVINVVLGYFLIKLIGLNGAAISTLVSYSFANYFGYLFIPKGKQMFISLSRALNPFHFLRVLNFKMNE